MEERRKKQTQKEQTKKFLSHLEITRIARVRFQVEREETGLGHMAILNSFDIKLCL